MSGAAMFGLVVAAVMSVAAPATATPGVSEDVIPSPQGILLHGSHGFEVAIDAHRATPGRRARVVVSAFRPHDLVRYTAPANLVGEGIRASLGRFGRIDLRWVPDGRIGEVDLACHGHGVRRHFLFDRGAYVGTLRFRGGDGFTAVRAHRIEWRPSWYDGHTTCHRGGSEVIPGAGRILEAAIGHRDPKVRFYAYQPKPGTKVEYEAYDRELVGRVEVERTAWTYGNPRTLTAPRDLAAATIAPPAPFTGSATFERLNGAHGSWLGDLAVRFPDVAGVPMAGDPFGAVFYSGSLAGESPRR
ncbi:MAG: hypothetical protein JST08_15350 [Actinobacteria bacterium]|nr:hypothetical protein [Actinomycetota bacterium]